MSKKGKTKISTYWSVKRVVVEEYEVFAPTRDEAKLLIENPHTVIVVKETIKRAR